MGLEDRVALVTGVSRRRGIGFAVADRLLRAGSRAMVHSWTAHDVDQPWGADEGGIEAVLRELGGEGPRLSHVELDLVDADAPARLVAAATDAVGPLNTLVVNHARSSKAGLAELTAQELDTCWAVNARSTLLLVQAFAAIYGPAAGPGRVVLFTSGQHLAPMPGQLPYAVTKGAVHQMTASLSDELVERGISVNCVNPGPTDTGWADTQLMAQMAGQLPRGRWNQPEEAAAVVAWLVGDDAASVTGQVINAEGGFRRWV